MKISELVRVIFAFLIYSFVGVSSGQDNTYGLLEPEDDQEQLLLDQDYTEDADEALTNIQSGLMGHWSFNDCTANDKSGNGNHGTKFGGTTCVNGVSGKAIQFDGSTGYINIPSASSLNPDRQLSISFWIKIQGYQNIWMTIMHKGGPYLSEFANREYTVQFQRQSFFEMSSAGDGLGMHWIWSPLINNTNWIHYVGVIDRLNHKMSIFLNGYKVAEAADNYDSFNINSDSIRIGKAEEIREAVSPLKGIVDDIRLYNRVLSTAEIADLYKMGQNVAGSPSNLTATAASASRINLSWTDNSTNESGFLLERKTGSSGGWSQIAMLPANTTTYASTGLQATTTYYYRVRAYSGTGNSNYSNESNATTLANKILTSIAITGPSTVNESSISNYTAKATFSNGSASTINPTWSLSSPTFATISKSGLLTTRAVTTNQTVNVKASYTYLGITKTAYKTVSIRNVQQSASTWGVFNSVGCGDGSGFAFSTSIDGVKQSAYSGSSSSYRVTTSGYKTPNYSISSSACTNSWTGPGNVIQFQAGKTYRFQLEYNNGSLEIWIYSTSTSSSYEGAEGSEYTEGHYLIEINKIRSGSAYGDEGSKVELESIADMIPRGDD